MENKKEFFKLYPSINDNNFWNNVSSGASHERNPRAFISARLENFDVLEILEAGKDKPILNIEGLMKFMNQPKYQMSNNVSSMLRLIRDVYHYLPEQMFRIFAIAFNQDPKYDTAQFLADECMSYYCLHGGDFEFLKLGMYRAVKDFNKRNSSTKIINFEDFNLFKTIKFLKGKSEHLTSLYDDVFESATNVFYLQEDLKNRGKYYNQETTNQLQTSLENGKDRIKNMIKNFDQNMVLNYLKTKKTYLKEQALDLIEKMNEIEINDYEDDEDFFRYEDQVEILEKDDKVCDFLGSIVKETEFVKSSNYQNKTQRKTDNNKTPKTPKAENISTKAD